MFLSAKTYEKYIVSRKYCIYQHDEKSVFHTRYQIETILDDAAWPKNLDSIRITYQQADCFYAIFKYRLAAEVLPGIIKFFIMSNEHPD